MRKDVSTIHALIQELAEYEKMPNLFDATPDLLEKTLSHENADGTFTPGYAKTLLITTPEGVVAGMAMYFYNYSTWKAVPGVYLEDLFVKPEYRKRGYGQALMKALAIEVVKVNGQSLDFTCLTWNSLGLRLFEDIGAKKTDAWVGLRVDGDALQKLAGS